MITRPRTKAAVGRGCYWVEHVAAAGAAVVQDNYSAAALVDVAASGDGVGDGGGGGCG